MSSEASPPSLLRSVHTTSFGPLLAELGVSVIVSTYQAGKLVVLRADEGLINTHFRSFKTPMGVACDGERLAVGTALEIWEFHNIPAVARKVAPGGKHDACFLPRTSHVTGNVQVHEMAWVGDELWFVNTRFSCLSRRVPTVTFRSTLAAFTRHYLLPGGDRCHLNGLLALRGGRVHYVTALGETDDPAGWRRNKKCGGVVIDVGANEVIARGLSMPHSPRWHDGRLWVLDSGNGGVGVIDEATGRYTAVAELPGFTRPGYPFPAATPFSWLTQQVSESAVFSGIAVVERPERSCGVWVLDSVSGQTVAYLKFEDTVQEIFAVQCGTRTAASPDVINDNDALIADSFVLPEPALADVVEGLRDPAV